MRLPVQREWIALMCLAAIAMFSVSGCRSGLQSGSSAWKRPDLGSMAFWKKDEQTVPKPPAFHFDPTPAEGERALAQSKPTHNTNEDLKASMDKIQGYAAADKITESDTDSFTESDTEQLADFSGSLKDKPLRAPYQLSLSNQNSVSQPAPFSPQAAPGSTNDVAGFNSTERSTNSQTFNSRPASPSASADFLAAMQNNQPPSPQGNGFAFQENPILPPSNQAPGSFAPIHPFNQNVNQAVSASQQPYETEMAKAKQEIADLKAQLAGGVQPLAPISGGGAGGGFQPIGGSSDRFASTTNDFMAGRSTGSNSLTPIDGGAQASNSGATFNPFTPQPTPGIGLVPLHPNESANSGAAGRQYPSTSFDGFSATNPGATSFDAAERGAVQPAGLQSPVSGWDEPRSQATAPATAPAAAPRNQVSEVAIPDAVLRGQGSYAPGSVNRLRNQ